MPSINRLKGNFAELHAAAYLARKDCEIVARNYRYRGGELDIVAKDMQGTFLFVEVKSVWKRDKGNPASRVTRTKQFKIWRTAAHFLHFHGGQDQTARFDVVSIDLRKGQLDIRYYPGAFVADRVIPQC